MIDKLFLFTNQEILFSATYIAILFTSMYISLKHNVQPTHTLLLIFIVSLIYLAITSIVKTGFLHYFPGMESLDSLIVFPGVFGVIIAIKILKRIFRIPYIVIDKLLGILFIFFAVFQINENFMTSSVMSSFMNSKMVPAGVGIFQMGSLQLSASIFPEMVLSSPILYTIMLVLLISTIFLYASSKLKNPGNTLRFTMLMLMLFLFISLFEAYPLELPALNDRMMGLNVLQWGLILTMVLTTAFMIAKESNNGRQKKEILFKPPGEYRILVIYLSISLISLHVTTLLSDLYIKLLFIGYFILTSYMIFYFMKKIERHYLKYGTVSIIMLIFIFFLRAQNPKPDQLEINAPLSPVDLGIKTNQSQSDNDNEKNLISFVSSSRTAEMDQD
jgi:hypothetical protein